MDSLNHNFLLSERQIFLRGALDSSGKTGGGFLVFCPSFDSGNIPETVRGSAKDESGKGACLTLESRRQPCRPQCPLWATIVRQTSERTAFGPTAAVGRLWLEKSPLQFVGA